MTISSTTVKNSYSGNGTLDTFNYTFKVFADADLQVIIRDAAATETVKTLTTHYTVTDDDITFDEAPPVGETVSVIQGVNSSPQV